MKTSEDIIHDLERLSMGDSELYSLHEKLRYGYKKKGLPYHELLKSKTFGTIKYLLVETHDELGTMLITDLDTNNTYYVQDPNGEQKVKEIEQRKRIQNWIHKK